MSKINNTNYNLSDKVIDKDDSHPFLVGVKTSITTIEINTIVPSQA